MSDAPPTQVMTRGAHRIKADGYCSRCALNPSANQGQCPPGFWMKPAEVKLWEAAYEKREHMALEKRLGSVARIAPAVQRHTDETRKP